MELYSQFKNKNKIRIIEKGFKKMEVFVVLHSKNPRSLCQI